VMYYFWFWCPFCILFVCLGVPLRFFINFYTYLLKKKKPFLGLVCTKHQEFQISSCCPSTCWYNHYIQIKQIFFFLIGKQIALKKRKGSPKHTRSIQKGHKKKKRRRRRRRRRTPEKPNRQKKSYIKPPASCL
jgi:hypothetical protein